MEYTYSNKWIYISLKDNEYLTIQDFFNVYIPSKKYQHLLIQNKNILLDNHPVKRETVLNGTILSINIYPDTFIQCKKILPSLKVIYEDELILVVDKPEGMLVHSDGNENITLTDLVRNYLPNYCEALPIHRLDKETRGLVLFSKSPIFHPLLDKMLNDKFINRKYLAFCLGKLSSKEFSISKPIGKNRHDANKMIISSSGDKAITRVREKQVIENKYSIVECTLLTGRTHQIRVHLSSIGCPIINDELYGVKSNIIPHMGLIAYKISLKHPLTNKNIEILSQYNVNK